MEGWVKIFRQLSENNLWTCEKFSRGQAWIDLLMLTNYKDSYFYVRNIKVNIKRGQLGWSETKLSNRWKWSRTKLRNFLNDLEIEQQIVQHKNNVCQIITIVNYETYQNKEQQKNSRRTAEEHIKEVIDKSITQEGEKTWRNDYQTYKKNCTEAFKSMSTNTDLKNKIENLYPNMDFDKSLAKSFLGYWSTEEGWCKKKKSDSLNIDWKSTIIKTINFNSILK